MGPGGTANCDGSTLTARADVSGAALSQYAPISSSSQLLTMSRLLEPQRRIIFSLMERVTIFTALRRRILVAREKGHIDSSVSCRMCAIMQHNLLRDSGLGATEDHCV